MSREFAIKQLLKDYIKYRRSVIYEFSGYIRRDIQSMYEDAKDYANALEIIWDEYKRDASKNVAREHRSAFSGLWGRIW